MKFLKLYTILPARIRFGDLILAWVITTAQSLQPLQGICWRTLDGNVPFFIIKYTQREKLHCPCQHARELLNTTVLIYTGPKVDPRGKATIKKIKTLFILAIFLSL